jgi:hypothetical protein
MQPPAPDETLADHRYVTLILRLTLDQGGQLVHGEVVDTTDTLLGRFVGVAGLNNAVQDWLTGRVQAEHDGQNGSGISL